MSKKRVPNAKYEILGVKMTRQEKEQVKRNAYKNLQNVSEYVRAKTLNDEA